MSSLLLVGFLAINHSGDEISSPRKTNEVAESGHRKTSRYFAALVAILRFSQAAHGTVRDVLELHEVLVCEREESMATE
jgi:hypothetical protein